MRLIDADALEKRFEYLATVGNDLVHKVTEEEKGMRTAYHLAKYETHVAPTISPESLQPQWIPVAERLPEDCDERFYMCVVENHESDPPMYLQYLENTGFGLWSNVFDEHTLGFVGSDFSTNEELGYEKVLAWMTLPEPYTAEGKDGNG